MREKLLAIASRFATYRVAMPSSLIALFLVFGLTPAGAYFEEGLYLTPVPAAGLSP